MSQSPHPSDKRIEHSDRGYTPGSDCNVDETARNDSQKRCVNGLKLPTVRLVELSGTRVLTIPKQLPGFKALLCSLFDEGRAKSLSGIAIEEPRTPGVVWST